MLAVGRDCLSIEFPPITISYKGLEADNSLIDLGQLGQSIQGASKLLGIAAHIAATGQYARRTSTLTVKVLAQAPRPGSFEIVAILVPLTPVITGTLPIIADQMKEAAKKAVVGIVSYSIAKLAGRPSEMELAMQVTQTAMTELGHTSRTAIQAMERVALNEKPAARLLIAPVGLSCETAQIGQAADGALSITNEIRNAIEESSPLQIGQAGHFDILISELDLKNRTCKFQIQGDEEDQRVSGDITDPALALAHNPYSAAMDNKRWLRVTAKPELRDGDIDKLYISDAATS